MCIELEQAKKEAEAEKKWNDISFNADNYYSAVHRIA